MADDSGKLTWKYALAITGTIILILLSINSYLIGRGIDSIICLSKENQTKLEKLTHEMAQRDELRGMADFRLDRRIDRLEVLVTMPFDKRIQVLKSLQGMGDKK